MTILFHIHYKTQWNEKINIAGSNLILGKWDVNKALELTTEDGENWYASIEVEGEEAQFSYKYFLQKADSAVLWEWGKNRVFDMGQALKSIFIQDQWRAVPKHRFFHSIAYSEVIFKQEPQATKKVQAPKLVFRVNEPRIPSDYSICLLGEGEAFQDWNEETPMMLTKSESGPWEIELRTADLASGTTYKFCIWNRSQNTFHSYEKGKDRILELEDDSDIQIYNIEGLKLDLPNWKGAGMAIPVFSLRSEKSFGVGEFLDLIPMVDLSLKMGMKMIQILPINDTTATGTYLDSYPYGAISVHALHPMYLSIRELPGGEQIIDSQTYKKEAEKLEAEAEVDYETVNKLKWKYIHKAYKKFGKDILASAEFKSFYQDNKYWLKAYAAFCFFREKYGNHDFNTWKEDKQGKKSLIQSTVDPDGKDYDEIGLYYFVQFFLDKQLKEASAYAVRKGIVLKGDIPIGIYRYSVEAWSKPNLFNMNGQSGAPPDDFSITGQNWGFPTYNWRKMAKDNFKWWRLRLLKMQDYFQAYRIDHILGFFRIWEISLDHVEGLMGKFNPALPYHINELQEKGIDFDFDRFCKPYIREYFLWWRFEETTLEVMRNYLHKEGEGFRLKNEVDSQRKIKNLFEGLTDEKSILIRDGLMSLANEVLFLPEERHGGWMLHPRIALHQTQSYRDLPLEVQQPLNDLYTDFFYHRHNEFWKEQANWKLPALVDATDMMVCGEDLGMVPDSVPEVMESEGILSLEIQRMPKGDILFGHPSDYPYESIASPSCHDMSTIRGWWEEDRDLTARFYKEILGNDGVVPFYCEPEVCVEMLNQHFYGQSVWTVLPLQDLIAIDGEIRREKPEQEQINVPANAQHYWRYRMHASIERLLAQESWTKKLKEMVVRSGR